MTATAEAVNVEKLKRTASVMESLYDLATEELGNDFTPAQEKMVLQKYGINLPQYTASEKNLILRDERQERGE